MNYGLDKNGKKVNIYKAIHDRNNQYFCPICHGDLIIKNGTKSKPYFAHKNLKDCDTFSKDTSEWHAEWINKFPDDLQEKIIKIKKHKDYFHFADIANNKYIIEFCNFPITQYEFNHRNSFFKEAGYKIIWVFNMSHYVNKNRIKFEKEYKINKKIGQQYTFSFPPKMFSSCIPQNDKNIIICFQLSENSEQLNIINWVPENKNTNEGKWDRFRTEKVFHNVNELIKFINK